MWTVDSGQWTVDSGQWTVDSGQRTVDEKMNSEHGDGSGHYDSPKSD